MSASPRHEPRVLFLDHVGEIGGAELSLLDIARRLNGRVEVLLFADGPFRERLEHAGVAVVVARAGAGVLAMRRASGFGGVIGAIPGVVWLARRVAGHARGFDVVYANSQKAFVVGALAARLARRPVVWHLRDILTAEHFGTVNRAVATRLANAGAKRVIANSRATADAFVAAGGRREKVRVVHNGVDPGPFDAAGPEAGAALCRELGCGEGTVLVGAFGRLAAWKGQHVLIEALVALPADVHVILVGGALFGEDAYAAELRRRARALGVAGRVHFLGFREDVPALMKAVDVVAHTSVAPEPFGRVIVEGMLAAKPVVASARGGAAEIVEDGANGLLVPSGDAGALAGAIRELLDDPARAAALGRRGRADAQRRFSLDACLVGIEAVLQDATRTVSGG